MTDGIRPGEHTDGHLTDEQLSSHLDDTAAPSAVSVASVASTPPAPTPHVSPTGAHLLACARCRDRLAELGAVRTLLRTPVPTLDRDARAASIATVLRRAEAARAPTPIRRRRPQVLVGAAAAVLVAAAIAVPLALSDHAGTNTAASAPASTAVHQSPLSGQASPSSSATNESAGPATTTVPDLGRLDSPDALRSGVSGLLGASAAAATATSQQPTPSTTGASGSTATVLNPPLHPTPDTTGAFERCLALARRVVGPTGTLQVLATADYKGTAALVFVFGPQPAGQTPGSGDGRQPTVVVVSSSSCGVLVDTSL
jgi:hypothetical protein